MENSVETPLKPQVEIVLRITVPPESVDAVSNDLKAVTEKYPFY